MDSGATVPKFESWAHLSVVLWLCLTTLCLISSSIKWDNGAYLIGLKLNGN